jgi:hypothetical protein
MRLWKKRNARSSERILAVLLAGYSVLTLQGAAWRQEVVDADGGGNFSSLRMDSYGNAHVSYSDDSQNLLKYSFWDHTLDKWFTTILDKRSSGFCSLTLDSKQRPHISYLEYVTGRLKYIHWDGATWKEEAIRLSTRSVEYYTSITLDRDDHPIISFYEVVGASSPDYVLHLRNVRWNGELWQASTIDWTPGSGKFNSIATDSAGRFHVAYANVKAENASLRYARWNGKSWEVEVLEGAETAYPVYSVSTVLDKDDIPHIASTDVANRLVKYATRRGGKWQFQVVDSLSRVGYPDRNGIVLDGNGNPYVSYYDAGAGILKVAHRERDKWISEVVDKDFAGLNSSIQIVNGEIFVTYYDSMNHSLKCARRLLEPADPLSHEKSVSISK